MNQLTKEKKNILERRVGLMRHLMVVILTMAIVFGIGIPLKAADWPTGPITMIIHSGQGGGADASFRTAGDSMSKHLGVQMRYKNIVGASGELALREALRRPADGYVLFTATLEPITFTNTLKNISDLSKEFAWLGSFARNSHYLWVSKKSPWTTAEEFFAAAKKQPLRIAFSSQRSTSGLVVEQLKQQIKGLQLVSVPGMKASKQNVSLLGGHVEALIRTMPGMLAIADSVRNLGVFLPKGETTKPGFPPNINDVLGTDVSYSGSIRTVMVKRAFKDNYPERFKTLLAGYNSIYDDPEFFDRAEKFKFKNDIIRWDGDRVIEQYEKLQTLIRKNIELFR